MKLQILSDLHLEEEKGAFQIPETDADVIVLAGGIHEGTKAIPWLKEKSDKPVIYIAGKNEYYGQLCPELKYEMLGQIGSPFELKRIIKDKKTGEILTTHPDQINFLEKGEVSLVDKFEMTADREIDKHSVTRVIKLTHVRFLGCTLFTAHNYLWSSIRYKRIKKITGYRNRTPSQPYWHNVRLKVSEFTRYDARQIFEESIGWLHWKLKEEPDIPTVVITHHAPSYRSNIMLNGERFIPDSRPDIQDAYMNNLDDFILEHQSNLKLWIHGHLHNSADYMIGNTRVICNPRGRGSIEEKNPDFDPALTVEIEGR